MIKFITSETNTPNTFGHVRKGQFFICCNGNLCQKLWDETTASIIANSEGDPVGDIYEDWDDDKVIKEILPHVIRIEF
jgi:hypothetical protein